MDRQLAERMVGAACLLAVLVLVVPAILDGSPDSGATMTHPSVEESLDLRTHTLRLDRAERDPPVPTAGQFAASLESSGAPAPAPASASAAVPVPVPTAPVAVPRAEPPALINPVAVADVAEPSAPTSKTGSGASVVGPTPSASTASPTGAANPGSGDWIVQLGSFAQRDNADRLAKNLRGKGFTASVIGGGGASRTLYRVCAGPEGDRAAAEALAGRLAAAGFSGGRVGQQ